MENELKKYWYYPKNWEHNQNQSIYHYLSLNYFLKILQTKHFHIKKKKLFPDKNESYLPLNCLFGYNAVGHNAPPINQEQIEHDYAELRIMYDEYTETKEFYTSCWTVKDIESDMMWTAFTQANGVRIKSSINKFLDSFKDISHYNIILGKIKYETYRPSKYANSYIFTKDKYFKDEQEIRFYFIPTESLTNHPDEIDLEIDINKMISSLTISPHIHPIVVSLLKEYLNIKYDLNVIDSGIHINF